MAEEVQAHTGAEAGGGIANELMAPQPGIMIWVWVVFIALLILLHKFAWKPILASVAERERKLKESLEKADQAAAKTAQVEAEQQRILAEARTEAGKILSEQRDFATKFRTQSEAEAKTSAEKIVAQAIVEIEAAKNQARTDLRKDAADLSVGVAERILRHKLQDAEAKDFAERMLVEAVKG
jgi:F-type H+-transporting ATPase subunit b